MKYEHSVSYREAFWIWVKVTIYSFGGLRDMATGTIQMPIKAA